MAANKLQKIQYSEKMSNSIRALARHHGKAAFDRLVELLSSSDERLSLAVAQEILNRAYGKPESARELREDETGPTVVVIRDGQIVRSGENLKDGKHMASASHKASKNDSAEVGPVKKASGSRRVIAERKKVLAVSAS